jgi:RNA 3'-phosphate cyclase
MIEIDGAHGEGGGQMLRTAVSLSAVLGEPVRVFNIREGRPTPGLSAQHEASIRAVADISGADVKGLRPGSSEIVFRPGRISGGDFEFAVGTAGSVSLVLQSCILPALRAGSRTNVTITGGTDVRWAPQIDYLRLVHLPLIANCGVVSELHVESRGFYPEGGGRASMMLSPANIGPLELGQREGAPRIEGIAYSQNLPEGVTARMKHAALKRLVGNENVRVRSEGSSGHSTGAGIVLSAIFENTVLGASRLGEKGVRAEVLGDECAAELTGIMSSDATVDLHSLDQLLPFMALARGRSTVTAAELTRHAETNMWVIEKFMGNRFSVEKTAGLVKVETL